jgi:hypothetical protein
VRKGIARAEGRFLKIAPIAALKALLHSYSPGREGRSLSCWFRILLPGGGGEPPPQQAASCRRYSSSFFSWRMAARSSATISCEALMAAACWFTLKEIAPTRA